MLMPYHVVHHHLLHGQILVRHVLALFHLFRRELGVIIAHTAPPHHWTTHHVSAAHHVPTVAHHRAGPHMPCIIPIESGMAVLISAQS